MTRGEEMREYLDSIGMGDCRCPWVLDRERKLHGVSMGRNWARAGADGACPHHGWELG